MKLTLLGLPLGNHLDISLRALAALSSADLVICEDTRVFLKLWQKLHNEGYLSTPFTGTLKVINEFHEKDRLDDLLLSIAASKHALLVSDAGLPSFSDPGFHLINQVIESGGELDLIPGPTAATSALVLSGLSSDRVLFLGFLPKKTAKRNRLFESIKALETGLTFILYESPYRTLKTLEEVKEKLGDLNCVIAKELTKSHQELIRGKISEVLKKLPAKTLKGEFVLLFRT